MEEHRKSIDRRLVIRRYKDRREFDEAVKSEYRVGQERREDEERRTLIRRH